MSIKGSQVGIFVVAAGAMFGVLSVARFAFYTEADAEYFAHLSGAGEEVADIRAEEAMTLSGGGLPIDQAKSTVASKRRVGLPAIQPKSGAGVAPIAGWVHHPDFAKRQAAAKAAKDAAAKAEAAAQAAAAAAPATAPATEE